MCVRYDDGSGWVEFAESTGDVTVVGIAPGVAGNCPGTMGLVRGYQGAPTCWRALDGAGSVGASYELAHDVGSIAIEELKYNQCVDACVRSFVRACVCAAGGEGWEMHA